ncbi:hypothetical protein [Flavobacterium pectinovorum]|jgi:predicted negative regulator of RcsB-dependent stress response|uniref:hypothetical protein n=1 Tax=Flavobacterium pectinovorum TaxID=29533 RepID=UPI001476D73B|nr:hypothetical protein [Flavobacterium pectinovorum]
MAEIKIEKKKPMWLLIVVLLIIGGLIYYIYFTDHETHTESSTEIENTSAQ